MNYYASPSGSGNGLDPSTPCSLASARTFARNDGGGNIYLRGNAGRYTLAAGLGLTALDNNIKWARFPADPMPEISGGVVVNPAAWVEHTTLPSGLKIWKAPVAVGLDARQFYVNGVRATRSYYKGAFNFYHDEEDTGPTAAVLSSSPDFPVLTRGAIEFVFTVLWTEIRLCALSTNKAGDDTWVTLHANAPKIYSWPFANLYPKWNAPTRIENALEFMSEEGEFYINPTVGSSFVYYIPRSGEVLATSEAIIPKVESLIYATDRLVGVEFSEIIFEHTSWMKPTTQGVYLDMGGNDYLDEINNFAWGKIAAPSTQQTTPLNFPKGAINLKSSSGLRIERCTVRYSGGAGVQLGAGTQDAFIQANHIYDISGNGLIIGNQDKWMRSGPEEDKTLRNIYRSNHIHNYGKEFSSTQGIHRQNEADCRCIYNEVHDTPYMGIVGGCSGQYGGGYIGNNEVAYNKVYRFGKLLKDGGGIYHSNWQGGKVLAGFVVDPENGGLDLHHNYVFGWANEDPGAHQDCMIYLDDFAYSVVSRSNVLLRGGLEYPDGANYRIHNVGDYDLSPPDIPVHVYGDYTDIPTMLLNQVGTPNANVLIDYNAPTLVDADDLPTDAAQTVANSGKELILASDLMIYGWKGAGEVVALNTTDGVIENYESLDDTRWKATLTGVTEEDFNVQATTPTRSQTLYFGTPPATAIATAAAFTLSAGVVLTPAAVTGQPLVLASATAVVPTFNLSAGAELAPAAVTGQQIVLVSDTAIAPALAVTVGVALVPATVAGQQVVLSSGTALAPTFNVIIDVVLASPTVTANTLGSGSIRGPDNIPLDLRDIFNQPITLTTQ